MNMRLLYGTKYDKSFRYLLLLLLKLFLGVFAKFRKAAISVIISLCVCLSVRMEQLGSHCTDFHDIRYSSIFRGSIEKIQVLLKSGKYDVHFT